MEHFFRLRQGGCLSVCHLDIDTDTDTDYSSDNPRDTDMQLLILCQHPIRLYITYNAREYNFLFSHIWYGMVWYAQQPELPLQSQLGAIISSFSFLLSRSSEIQN